MKSNSVIKLAVYGLTLATLFLNGCGQSEQAREAERLKAIDTGLETANRLLYAGETDQALSKLESLDQLYPNNPEVLEALAFAYAKKPDHALAAFYFDTVVQLDPERAELALYAARSHSETGDTASAARAYEVYLKDSPDDAAAWREMAKALTAERQTKPALDAWLQALRLSDTQPSSLEAAQIGKLYLNLDNLPQAQRLFNASLKAPTVGNAHEIALLGLLEIDLRKKRWVDAEQRIAELDKVAPKALDNSPLASARLELQKWREAQAELERQRIAESEAVKKKAEEATQVTANTAEKKKPGTITIGRTGETISLTSNDEEGLPPALDKSLPGPPAHSEEQGQTDTSNVEADTEGSVTKPVVANDDGEIPPTPLADGADSEQETTTTTASSTIASESITPAEPALRERGDLAYEAGNYEEAVRLYQAALAEEPNAAPAYYGLSRAYYQLRQWPQAELYASEARRLSPGDLRYTINFLRAIQRTQSAERLMTEMVRAKERFPNSPDLTLALARGYERLYNNRRNAIFLYQEFLTMAPGHPQAEDVRVHLQGL